MRSLLIFSVSACIKAQKVPPPGWSRPNDTPNAVFSPTNRELKQGTLNTLLGDSWAADHTGGLGAVHGIGAPIHVYPLYENAYRAHYGQTIPENNKESADMYYDFARTAEQNPYAWNYKRCVKNAAAIGQVSKENRMICYPCLSSIVSDRDTLTGHRSFVNERVQHCKFSSGVCTHYDRVCKRYWYTRVQMDIRPWRCRYRRQQRL